MSMQAVWVLQPPMPVFTPANVSSAGRLGATAAYARLHSSERFQEQMRLARLEFRCKKGIATAAEQKTYKKILKKRNKK